MSCLLLLSTAVVKLPFSVQSEPRAIVRITETFRFALFFLSVSGNIMFPQSPVLTVNRNLATYVVIAFIASVLFCWFYNERELPKASIMPAPVLRT